MKRSLVDNPSSIVQPKYPSLISQSDEISHTSSNFHYKKHRPSFTPFIHPSHHHAPKELSDYTKLAFVAAPQNSEKIHLLLSAGIGIGAMLLLAALGPSARVEFDEVGVEEVFGEGSIR